MEIYNILPLNKYLILIIQKYTLPTTESIKSNKIKYLDQLHILTVAIRFALNSRVKCINYKYRRHHIHWFLKKLIL
jgi:hypothetical protein